MVAAEAVEAGKTAGVEAVRTVRVGCTVFALEVEEEEAAEVERSVSAAQMSSLLMCRTFQGRRTGLPKELRFGMVFGLVSEEVVVEVEGSELEMAATRMECTVAEVDWWRSRAYDSVVTGRWVYVPGANS